MTKPLRVAVCGYGALGHVHADSLMKIPGLEPVAVCDIRPEQFQPKDAAFNLDAGAGKFDVRRMQTFTDYKTMLREVKLDLLVSALPTDLHAEVSIAAMEAGLHVFCEKPMALNSDQAQEMVTASRRTGKKLMIGQCLRFWPEYEALKQAIDNRTYGDLRVLRMTRVGAYAEWSAFGWMSDAKRSGGAILDLHLHDVDFAWHALGRPRAILASGQVGKTGGIDDVTAVWDYGNCQVTMVGSWMYRGFRMSYEAVFEEAVLAWPSGQKLNLQRKSEKTAQDVPVSAESAYVREVAYLCDCIRADRQPARCLPEDTLETVRLVELERRSIATKNWITL